MQLAESNGEPDDRDHQAYLHGRWFQYVLERQGRLTDDPEARYNAVMKQQAGRARRGVYRRHRPVYNEYGFTKGTIDSDQSEDNAAWREGAGGAVIFPYMSAPGDEGPGIRRFYQIGVPVDDTTTWHLQYTCFVFPEEVNVPNQEVPTYVEVPLKDQKGEYILDYLTGQDMVAFCGQGTITDRESEHLGVVDHCIIAYRKILREQIAIVQDGGEPMNVFRDPAKTHRMDRSFAVQKAAIVKKRLNLDPGLYSILQILSVAIMEKTPISQVLSQFDEPGKLLYNNKQLILFN